MRKQTSAPLESFKPVVAVSFLDKMSNLFIQCTVSVFSHKHRKMPKIRPELLLPRRPFQVGLLSGVGRGLYIG